MFAAGAGTFPRSFQQSRRSDADGKDDDQRHECRSDALLSVVSTSGRLSAARFHGDGLAAAAGTALALQPTRLLEGADEADVTDGQDDERNEERQQRPEKTIDEVETRPAVHQRTGRLCDTRQSKYQPINQSTRMWANAQRDGRPAEHRWRPLFNAAKFG